LPYYHELKKITEALESARKVLSTWTLDKITVERKAGGSPVTQADLAVNKLLRERLPAEGEGWLSEESKDPGDRLDKSRVWIVDPLDGTKEFISGIPEWCVSIGLVEDGVPVAGGILNPAADLLITGAAGHGVTLNGEPSHLAFRATVLDAEVLASRSEVNRGEWNRFQRAPFKMTPCGSVAYKLGCVAAGLADATWTLVPKNEWDVAGGVALILAAGGRATLQDGSEIKFNRPDPLLPGLVAANKRLHQAILGFLRSQDAVVGI
jgi:myo-inositol-1(or 4)-monophosphatase